MAVAALLDLGADVEKLNKTLKSLNLEGEFDYKISDVFINSIRAKDFDVILPESHVGHDIQIDNKQQTNFEHHHGAHFDHNHENHNEHHHRAHVHRNLDDVNKIIENADCTDSAKVLAKKIFRIMAEAEAKVHGKSLDMVHFHEVGAIDSIADILSFAVLFDDLNPKKAFISTLSEGQGFVECAHGSLPVPVPAVCEIAEKYKLKIKITENNGEMVTPTGAAIAAAICSLDIFEKELPEEFFIKKTGYGAGKRKYKNPFLRVMDIGF